MKKFKFKPGAVNRMKLTKAEAKWIKTIMLKDIMGSLGRKGGKKKTAAQTAARRKNGKKGGRRKSGTFEGYICNETMDPKDKWGTWFSKACADEHAKYRVTVEKING